MKFQDRRGFLKTSATMGAALISSPAFSLPTIGTDKQVGN